MYTKKELKSKKFMNFYEAIAKRCYKDLSYVEGFLTKRAKKRELKVNIENKLFESNDNMMHYTGIINRNEPGEYIGLDVSKKFNKDELSINLIFGATGYDIHTGERYDRHYAEVSYKYDKKVILESIKSEKEINQEEENRLKECQRKIKQFRKPQ